jgi:predicted metal-dependent hydrolase
MNNPKDSLLSLLAEEQYFKLHEDLEALWMQATEDPTEAQRYGKKELQGIIQLVVGLHHLKNGNTNGFKKLLQRASPKLAFHETCPLKIKALIKEFIEKNFSEEHKRQN